MIVNQSKCITYRSILPLLSFINIMSKKNKLFCRIIEFVQYLGTFPIKKVGNAFLFPCDQDIIIRHYDCIYTILWFCEICSQLHITPIFLFFFNYRIWYFSVKNSYDMNFLQYNSSWSNSNSHSIEKRISFHLKIAEHKTIEMETTSKLEKLFCSAWYVLPIFSY